MRGVVTVLVLLGVLGVLFAAGVLATREGPILADAPPDVADLALPEEPLRPEDVRGLRFSLAARGYRMSEVDRALERLAAELADRDRRIGLLQAAAQGPPPEGGSDAGWSGQPAPGH
jgi:DivIVA domain-containing protein